MANLNSFYGIVLLTTLSFFLTSFIQAQTLDLHSLDIDHSPTKLIYEDVNQDGFKDLILDGDIYSGTADLNHYELYTDTFAVDYVQDLNGDGLLDLVNINGFRLNENSGFGQEQVVYDTLANEVFFDLVNNDFSLLSIKNLPIDYDGDSDFDIVQIVEYLKSFPSSGDVYEFKLILFNNDGSSIFSYDGTRDWMGYNGAPTMLDNLSIIDLNSDGKQELFSTGDDQNSTNNIFFIADDKRISLNRDFHQIADIDNNGELEIISTGTEIVIEQLNIIDTSLVRIDSVMGDLGFINSFNLMDVDGDDDLDIIYRSSSYIFWKENENFSFSELKFLFITQDFSIWHVFPHAINGDQSTDIFLSTTTGVYWLEAFHSYVPERIQVPADYATIQEALDSALDGDTILVSPGTYFENLAWPIGVRDLKLLSSHGAEQTVLDGTGKDDYVLDINEKVPFSNNAIAPFIDKNTLVDGFSIKNGNGGISLIESGPILQNLIVEDNIKEVTLASSNQGAGIHLYLSNGLIQNCIIRNNHVDADHGIARGAGINSGNSPVTIKDCLIAGNTCTGFQSGYGAGIYATSRNFKIVNCIIENNTAETNGAGLYVTSGGFGGNSNGSEVTNTLIRNNTVLDSTGSSIEVRSPGIEFNNCTVVNNNSGLKFTALTDFQITNSIFYNNGPLELGVRQFNNNDLPSLLKASYSFVDGGFEGQGNISGDPGFISATNFSLQENSICVNAGNPDKSPSFDFDGMPRPLPIGTRPDLGIYEIEQNSRNIHVQFFLDENENGIKDGNESNLALGRFEVNGDQYNNTLRDGVHLRNLDSGEYTIRWLPNDPQNWELTSGPVEYTINLNAFSVFEKVLFGLKPIKVEKRLINGISAPILICNESITMTVSLINQGTTIEKGNLWIEIDERMKDVLPLQSPDIDSTYKLAWSFENLVPGESIRRQLLIEMPDYTQEITDEVFLFRSIVETDGDPDWKHEIIYEDVIDCFNAFSYKLSVPDREGGYVLLEEEMQYTIHFQNDLEDYAENVRITDVIDDNLDISSFKLVASSHPEYLNYYVDDRVVHFDFNEIFLPYSAEDFNRSKGYVMYSINPDSTLVGNVQVDNTADIAFLPIDTVSTNTTTNIIVADIPSHNGIQVLNSIDIQVFPNPSKGEYYFSEKVDEISVYNIHGQQVQQIQDQEKINLFNYPDGIYFLRLTLGNKLHIKKIILTRG